MDQDFQRALLRRLFDLRAQRTTSMADSVRWQSTGTYTDGDQFDAEKRLLFGGRPLVAGLSCDLPGPGDYFTVDLGGTPALVVRSESGFVSAFLNACRHRGAPVATGCGDAGRVFKCPFHAWTYDSDGRLLGRPGARTAFDERDTDCLGLIRLPATEAGGLIWVRPDPEGEAIDPRDDLAGLEPELRHHGFDRMVPFTQRDSVWSMNWKQPYETFLEGYHIFSLHRQTLALELMSTPMLTDTFGPHGRGALLGRAAPRLLELDESEWTFARHANLLYWLFPNTIVSLPMSGHVELWQFWPLDDSIGRTRITARFYIPPEQTGDEKRAFWDRMVEFTMQVVTTEDFPQQEGIWRSVSSGRLPAVVFGRNEPALIHYHRSLDEALGRSGVGELRV